MLTGLIIVLAVLAIAGLYIRGPAHAGRGTHPAASLRQTAPGPARRGEPTPPGAAHPVSGLHTALIGGMLILTMLVIFIVQNAHTVHLSFLGAHLALRPGPRWAPPDRWAVFAGLTVIIALVGPVGDRHPTVAKMACPQPRW
jgi:uncharacterized integral membrane protein